LVAAVKLKAERRIEMEINVTVSAMKFTSLKMDISNNVRKMKDSLDQRISSALPSTMSTNGTSDKDSTIVLMKQIVLSPREQGPRTGVYKP
jgi:hypothetical protein